MGCGASAPQVAAPASAADNRQSTKEERATRYNQQTKRMSMPTDAAARRMFSEYRRRSSQIGAEGSDAPKKMDYDGLRALLSESGDAVDDDLFSFLLKIFDPDGDGFIDTNEFMLALSLLAQKTETPEDQVEATFSLFDVDATGTLSREEFEQMIQVTVNLNLSSLLQTEEGMATFEEAVKAEYSEENLAFWRATQAYAELDDEDARRAKAAELIATYVKSGAELQVNLPSAVQAKVLKGAEGAARELFVAAAAEIFRLMERDTYRRFREEGAAQKLVDEFFSSMGENDGVVQQEQFSEWAMSHPQVLVLFAQLSKIIRSLIEKKKLAALESFKAKDAEAPAAAPATAASSA